MTPKSLLRHKNAVSDIADFAEGTTFHRLLWDDATKLVADKKMRRVVLCSGKVYYDLYEEREKRGINDIYLLRVEQLYPFPAKALITELLRFQAGGVCLVPGRAEKTWAPGHSLNPIWNGCSIMSVLNRPGPAMPEGRPPRLRQQD